MAIIMYPFVLLLLFMLIIEHWQATYDPMDGTCTPHAGSSAISDQQQQRSQQQQQQQQQ